MNMYRNHRSGVSGFTFIELSVMLVTIGLIIGGIFAGKSLIRSAKLQSVIADEIKYVEAAKQFKEKYGYLPGDFPNATTYWGAMTTCPPTAGSTSTGILTCNGSGDTQVNFLTNASASATNLAEAFLFWQHLGNAQMIEGSYTGIAGSAGSGDHVLGTNSPLSKTKNIGFGITYVGLIKSGKDINGNSTTYFDYNYGHVLVVGGVAAGYLPATQVFTGAEAQSLDSKYDDGLPQSGNVLTWANGTTYNAAPVGSGYASVCSSATAYYTSAIAYGGALCSLILVTGF